MPKITSNYSPNFSLKTRISILIKYIIIHYTGMVSEKKAIDRLTDKKSKVSYVKETTFVDSPEFIMRKHSVGQTFNISFYAETECKILSNSTK